ncbi:hypothetical protein [Brevundimonas diminuta]|uniref:hypothetical protein n=1 Tax=Brevundimonas diminuta TaxID=293 RepID=UPI003CFCFF20
MIAIVVLGLLSAGLGVASAQDIDTRTGPPNGGVAFYALKTTSGVVIAAPASSDQLRSFSIAIENATGPVSTQGLVMGWSRDGWRAVGPVLYLSAPTVVADAGRIDVAFTPPTPIPVTPGRQYVIAVKGASP